jgi:holliday junction DNA helicase RuvA
MMEYIKGTLASASPVKIVVDIGGIGYKIYTPLSNYSKLPHVGQSVCFFVLTVIRDDSHKNYGFLTPGERDLFEALIDVSGIGPKTGLALLGHLEPSDLQVAISQSDVTGICKVPGIGKKTAERLIIEMRDRVQKNNTLMPPSTTKGDKTVSGDAVSALINLGYQPAMAQKTIQSILSDKESEPDLSELISSALKKL